MRTHKLHEERKAMQVEDGLRVSPTRILGSRVYREDEDGKSFKLKTYRRCLSN